jgi:glycosyltransferase involved in cell wall biosynthesis
MHPTAQKFQFYEVVFMKPIVTVVVPVYDSEKFVHECMQSLLAQTVRDFEILVIEDPPYDRTKEIVDAFEDRKIKYFRNPKRLGRYKSRNLGIQQARGKYVFFTDDDCVVSKDWIEQGLKSFHNENCIAVEGKTYYVSDEYKPGYSNHVVKQSWKGDFMTCNVAYKKSFIESIGGFDERYKYHGDRDLGLRAIKFGRIHFNPKMMVYHRKVKLKPREFVRDSQKIRARVLLYKKFGEIGVGDVFCLWRIVNPHNLLRIFFPPLILVDLLHGNFRSRDDFALLPFVYIKLIYERLNLWDMCVKERVFLI